MVQHRTSGQYHTPLGFANNKGADQPAHPHSLISTFVIRLLKSIISKLATSEISISSIVSVAKQAGLGMTLVSGLLTTEHKDPNCPKYPGDLLLCETGAKKKEFSYFLGTKSPLSVLRVRVNN